MRIVFILHRYFPYGGLQRDLFAVASLCAAAGHQVRIHAQRWEGPEPAGCEVQCLPVAGRSNHVRARRFAALAVEKAEAWNPDRIVGFDKMSGLDVYFAADPCFIDRAHGERSRVYRLLPRCRQFSALERGVFGPDSSARILLLDGRQEPVYRRWYGTESGRFVHLPPGVAPDRRAGPEADELRQEGRSELGIDDDTRLLLMLGSDFHRKGCDRALRALAALPQDVRAQTRFLVVGADAPKRMQRLATRLKLGNSVQFSPGRDDVPRLLQAADLLLHPARTENTGTVLLEAMVAGLPVLTTAACGYAPHIDSASSGIVLREPFRQAALDAALVRMLVQGKANYRRRALAYAARNDLHGLHARVLAEIEAGHE